MFGHISFPFFKIDSAFRCGGKSPGFLLISCVLLTLFSSTVHSAADVEIQAAPAIANSTAPFNVSVVFSEDVTEFISTDVTLANAAVTAFNPVDGANYNVEITPDGGGDISIDIPAGVALDAAFMGNNAATQVIVAYDATPPSVEIQGTPAIVNSVAAFNVTVVFSEIVTGFIATDVSVGNGSATGVTSGDGITYSVEITPDGGGDISIDIPADVAQDTALNGNTAATQVNVVYDFLPSVDIQGEPATFNSTAPFDVTVEFSEPVTGFIDTDVSVTNADVTNFIPVDGDTYTVQITPTAAADISIDIAAGVALDATMNGNTAALQAIVAFANLAPIANAGADRSVGEGASVTLDGSASSDISPDAVASYSWTQTDGPGVALSDSSAEMPDFIAPFVSGGDIVLQFDLVVTDSLGAPSTVDSVTITVTNALAVDAGVDQQITEGDVVHLSGLNSLSINSRIVRYRWVQTEGPAVTLDDRSSATPSFVAPPVDVTTLLAFELVTADASGARDHATTLVNVRDQLLASTAPPLDVQLANKSVSSGAPYQFDTIGDPFGPSTVVEWSQVSGPDVTLNNANPVVPSFIAPTVPADIATEFEVRSTDLNGLVVRAGVNVNILEPLSTNLVPVADAGVDQVATEGDTVQLDATGSTDADGSIVGYYWHQTAGPGVLLSSIIHARPTFVAPAIAAADTGTTLSFEVVVIDDGGFIDRDSVTVAIPDNGITGFDDDLTTIDNALGDSVGIQVSNGNLISLHAVHPVSIVDPVNRPSNLPYGLFDFGVRVEPGASVQVSFILPRPASSDLTWWKYTNIGGWMEYSAGTSFNPARDVVTITITDNGIGDDDPVLGVIRDPGGLGPADQQTSNNGLNQAVSSGSSGGSAGPFLLIFLLLNVFAAAYRKDRVCGQRR